MEDGKEEIIDISTQKQEIASAPEIPAITVAESKSEPKYNHIAVRPETFKEFRKLRGSSYSSDDAFIKALLNPLDPAYTKYSNHEKETKPASV